MVRASKNKVVKKQLGKANPLSGALWDQWLEMVFKELPAKYFVMLYLTQALCLRSTQVASLQSGDFDFEGERVWLKPFKRKAAVWKPLLPSVFAKLCVWRQAGLRSPNGDFKWPTDGYLFPARKGATRPFISKDVVAHAIKPLEERFRAKKRASEKHIRSHSGRRHNISSVASSGTSDSVGMTWSQIDSHRVYRGYVDLCPEDVRSVMEKVDKTKPIGMAGVRSKKKK